MLGSDGAGLGREVMGEEGWKAALKEWSRSCKMKWLTKIAQRYSQSLVSWLLVNGSSGSSRVFWLQVTENSTRKRLMPKETWLTEKSEGRSCFRNVLIQVLKQCHQALPSLHVSASSMGILDLRLLVGARWLQQLQACLLRVKLSITGCFSFPSNLNESPGPDSLGQFWVTDQFLNHWQWLRGHSAPVVQARVAGPPRSTGLREGRVCSQVNPEHCWQKEEDGFRPA